MELAELLNSGMKVISLKISPRLVKPTPPVIRFSFLVHLRNWRGWSLLFGTLVLGFLPSCSGPNLRSSYDPTYEVIDRGGLDILIRGRACAVEEQEAERLARETVGFHLRSVVKGERYLPKFRTVRVYSDGNRWCAEVAVRPQKPD